VLESVVTDVEYFCPIIRKEVSYQFITHLPVYSLFI
jgi:hypothetical protein